MAPSTTMKVASWETTGTISTVDKQIPELKPGYILVRVTASGICGKVQVVKLLFHRVLTWDHRHGFTYLQG